MANRLVAERRRFVKPMRLTARRRHAARLPSSRTRPRTTAIEVYGMESQEAYRVRKAAKQALDAAAAIACGNGFRPPRLLQ